MEGHANINPRSCPLFFALLLASRGVLFTIWTVARQKRGMGGRSQAGVGGNVTSVPSGPSLATY